MEFRMRARISNEQRDKADVARLFGYAGAGLISIEDIVVEDGFYVVDHDDCEADYLAETLEHAAEARNFEPFSEWDRRHADQLPLEFGGQRSNGNGHSLEDAVEA